MYRHLFKFSLLVLILFLFSAVPVLAHANLVRSEPAANSALQVPPQVVRLWFSEAVEPSFSNVRVLDKSSAQVDTGDSHRMTDDLNGMQVTLNRLPEGLYTVVWKTTSAVDGHVTTGSFSFTVGAVSLSDSSPSAIISLLDNALASDAPPPLYQVIVRWLNILLLTVLVGGLIFPLLVLFPAIYSMSSPTPPLRSYVEYMRASFWRSKPKIQWDLEAAATRWLGWLRVIVVLFALLTGVSLFAQAYTVGGVHSAIPLLFSSRFGLIWLMRAFLVLGLALILFRARGRTLLHFRDKRLLAAVCILGLSLIATQSLNSHGAAITDPPFVAFLVDYVHLLGVAIWIGGLVQLLVTLPAFVRGLPEQDQSRAMASAISTFSIVAFATVGAIVVTGAYSAFVQVGSLDAFFNTLYGTTLFEKFVLIIPLLALGALNLIITRPASAHGVATRIRPFLLRFNFAVALEIVLAALVFLAVGVMTSVSPAKGAYNPSPALWIETHRAQDLSITLAVAPGLVGTNDFDIKVIDNNGQPVSNALLVRLLGTMREMDMGTQQVNATNQGNGHYTLHGDLMSMVGTWQLEALVRRAGVEDVVTSFSVLALGTRLPQTASPLLVTSREAQGGLGLTLVGFATGVSVVLIQKRRRLRLAFLGVALAISLVGGFVVYQVGATAPATAFIVPTVPIFARNARPPIAPVPSQLSQGQEVYVANCATCHGVSGKGDGPSAAALTPKPADLTVHALQHTEGELYWWVTNGITTTAMPAWDTRLSDLQRWQVVLYIRTLGVNPTPSAPVGASFPAGASFVRLPSTAIAIKDKP